MNKKAITKNKGFSFAAISNTRGYIMGLATFMVVFCHSYISFDYLFKNAPFIADTLNAIRKMGVSGVDVFLIISGFGLYYSFSNNSKIIQFYKKRITRILPAAIIVPVFWYAQKDMNGLGDFFKKVTNFNFYTDGVRNFWYLALIVVLYAIYPLIHKLIEKTGIYGTLGLIALTVTGTLLLKKFDYQQYLYIEIALWRIPTFFLGVWFARLAKKDVHIPYFVIAILGILLIPATVMGFHYCSQWISEKAFNYGTLIMIQRLLGNVIGVCTTLVFAALLNNRNNPFTTFLTWLGSYSLEIYLIHGNLGGLLYSKISTGDPSHLAYYIIVFIISIPLAMALKAFSDSINKNLFYRNAAKK